MLKWLFGPSRSDVQLVRSILRAETERSKLAAQREERKFALEEKQLELEMANIEAIGEEKRKDRADKEKLRLQRIEWAKAAREKKAAKAVAGVPGVQGGADPTSCPVCKNPGDARLTSAEIAAHYAHLRVPLS